MAFCEIMSAVIDHSSDKTIRRARQPAHPRWSGRCLLMPLNRHRRCH